MRIQKEPIDSDNLVVRLLGTVFKGEDCAMTLTALQIFGTQEEQQEFFEKIGYSPNDCIRGKVVRGIVSTQNASLKFFSYRSLNLPTYTFGIQTYFILDEEHVKSKGQLWVKNLEALLEGNGIYEGYIM